MPCPDFARGTVTARVASRIREPLGKMGVSRPLTCTLVQSTTSAHTPFRKAMNRSVRRKRRLFPCPPSPSLSLFFSSCRRHNPGNDAGPRCRADGKPGGVGRRQRKCKAVSKALGCRHPPPRSVCTAWGILARPTPTRLARVLARMMQQMESRTAVASGCLGRARGHQSTKAAFLFGKHAVCDSWLWAMGKFMLGETCPFINRKAVSRANMRHRVVMLHGEIACLCDRQSTYTSTPSALARWQLGLRAAVASWTDSLGLLVLA